MSYDVNLFQLLDYGVEEFDEKYVEDLIRTWRQTRKNQGSAIGLRKRLHRARMAWKAFIKR